MYLADAVERRHLVNQDSLELVRAAVHVPTAKPQQVRVARVGANGHVLGQSQFDRVVHGQRVGCMKPAGNTGHINVGHDFGIHALGPGAEALAHVAVEFHCVPPKNVVSCITPGSWSGAGR